jgi:hypothetical protein
MGETIQFIPKSELGYRQNLSDFIVLCMEYPCLKQRKANVPPYSYQEAYWGGIVNFVKHGVSSRSRNSDLELDDSIMPFAKAYFTYRQSHHRTANPNEIKALRVLEAAMIRKYGEADITNVVGADFDLAAEIAVVHYSKAAAFQCGGQLQKLSEFLTKKNLAKDPAWKNQIPRAEDTIDRVGAEGEAYRLKKIPSEDALFALAEIFSLGEDKLSDRDIFTTSTIAILMAAPARASEIFYLPFDCIHTDTSDDGNNQLGLRWFSGKGYGHDIEWIPQSMHKVVKIAVARLQKISFKSRSFALNVENGPLFLNFPDKLIPEGLLTREQVSYCLGLDVAQFEQETKVRGRVVHKKGLDTKKGQTASNQLLKRFGIPRENFQVSYPKLNEIVRSTLTHNGFPYVEFGTVNPPALEWSNSLFCQFGNAFHRKKRTYTTELWMPHIDTLNEDMEPTKKASKSGNGMTKQLSIFERYNYPSDLKIKSHQFRHLLSTLAKKAGMSDTLLTKWSKRADPKQTRVYNHLSPEDMFAKVRKLKNVKNTSVQSFSEYLVVTPETLQEFNANENITAHNTEFGACTHSYVLNPCHKFGACIGCEELHCEKGNNEKLERIKAGLEREMILLDGDLKAVQEGLINSEVWLEKRRKTIDNYQDLIAILEDNKIPDGSIVKLSTAKISQLDKALDKNDKARLPKLDCHTKKSDDGATLRVKRPESVKRLMLLRALKNG